ncbi:MAG: hypothetical protein AAB316_03435, partial [Bacteroidota bacterium]
MENNLDRFFRENLSERQFEFKDEYWQEAEKLLDANKRRRRRALIFWWLGGAALVATVAMAVVAIGGKNERSPSVARAENQAVASENFNNEKTGAPAPPDRATTETSPETSLPGGKSAARKGRGSSKTSAVENGEAQKTTTQKIANEITAAQNATVENAETVVSEAISSELEQPSSSQISEAASAETDASIFRQKIDFQRLPPVLNGVSGDFSKQLKVSGEPKKQPESPFHFGFVAGQIFQVQPDSGEQTILGWHAGLALQRDLGKGFFAATGLEYLRRDGHFDASKSSERLN